MYPMTNHDKAKRRDIVKRIVGYRRRIGRGSFFVQYKESERTFLARRRLSRDLKEEHVDEMCSYLQSIFISTSLLE